MSVLPCRSLRTSGVHAAKILFVFQSPVLLCTSLEWAQVRRAGNSATEPLQMGCPGPRFLPMIGAW
jgi:hypothetical protein